MEDLVIMLVRASTPPLATLVLHRYPPSLLLRLPTVGIFEYDNDPGGYGYLLFKLYNVVIRVFNRRDRSARALCLSVFAYACTVDSLKYENCLCRVRLI